MRTPEEYLKDHPRALPSTLTYIQRRYEKVEQLKRETAARTAAGPHNVPDAFRVLDYAPAEQDTAERRQSIIDRWMPWARRRI